MVESSEIAFAFLIFSVQIFSGLRGHSFFSSTPQRPITSNFEGSEIADGAIFSTFFWTTFRVSSTKGPREYVSNLPYHIQEISTTYQQKKVKLCPWHLPESRNEKTFWESYKNNVQILINMQMVGW